nr:MAG TPA: hypothetical protein [Caudoviricetes sp.]
MNGHKGTPAVQAQGQGDKASFFCKVFKTNRSSNSPDRVSFNTIQDGTKISGGTLLRFGLDTASNVFIVRIAHGTKNLSVEVNFPRHFLTSFLLLGALIVALVRQGKERAA